MNPFWLKFFRWWLKPPERFCFWSPVFFGVSATFFFFPMLKGWCINFADHEEFGGFKRQWHVVSWFGVQSSGCLGLGNIGRAWPQWWLKSYISLPVLVGYLGSLAVDSLSRDSSFWSVINSQYMRNGISHDFSCFPAKIWTILNYAWNRQKTVPQCLS